MYASANETMVPARFMLMVTHLIATLTVLYDSSAVAHKSGADDFAGARSEVEGLAYAAVICLGLQFVGVLSGTSFFFPALNALQVLAHFLGTCLVGLFVSQGWPIGTYSWCFIIFALVPAIAESFVALAVFRFRVLDYAG